MGEFAKPSMKRIFLVSLTLWALAGCAPERPGLIVQSYPFNPAGKAVLIQCFAFNPEIATAVDKERVRGFGESIALDIQTSLKNAGFRHPLVITPGEAAKGDVLIQGSITRVHGGDLRQRQLLETFGFGATEVRAAGEVIDLATSRSILGFSFTKQSHYSWLDNESAARENLREIAREIAAAFVQMRE
jgi:hypothetical protein